LKLIKNININYEVFRFHVGVKLVPLSDSVSEMIYSISSKLFLKLIMFITTATMNKMGSTAIIPELLLTTCIINSDPSDVIIEILDRAANILMVSLITFFI
jgi:hypothetical protein